MAYKVEFLDDREFEALPYPDMDIALGVADPKLGRAYVRRTGIPMVDYFNMAHELEHLEDGDAGAHADHKRHGVYYKLPFLAPLLGGLGSIGGALGSGAGALGGLASSLGSVAPAVIGVGKQVMDMKAQSKAAKQAAGGGGGYGQPNVMYMGGQPGSGAPNVVNAGAGTTAPSTGTPGTESEADLIRKRLAQQNQSGNYLGR